MFNQSGGTNSASSFSLGNQGTYNLSGGLLILQTSPSASGNAAFNFSGGTLQAAGSWSTAMSIAWNQRRQRHVRYHGKHAHPQQPLCGPGGLIKTGGGTLVLNTANTFSGGTTIDGGVLQLGDNAALVAGPLAVNSGGTLDLHGHGTIITTLSGSGTVLNAASGAANVADFA